MNISTKNMWYYDNILVPVRRIKTFLKTGVYPTKTRRELGSAISALHTCEMHIRALRDKLNQVRTGTQFETECWRVADNADAFAKVLRERYGSRW